MDISGTTRLMGILGKGISYTLSPSIHNFSAQRLGLDIAYVPFDMEIKDTKQTLDLFWDLGVLGFNVTTPYKKTIAAAVKSQGNLASVNTVYRGEQGWLCTSTDAHGFARAVSRMGLQFEGFNHLIILGVGGAVSALLSYVATHFDRFPKIDILRRNPAKDAELKAQLPASLNIQIHDFDPRVFENLCFGAAGETLVIQGTNAPQRGDDLKRFAPGFSRYSGAFVDLVYGASSALIDAAKDRGIPYQDGLPMLIEQARIAQTHWWNASASFEDIHSFLSSKLGL